MSRVGARREREGTVPRATAVPRLAKPARHAGYAPGAHRSVSRVGLLARRAQGTTKASMSSHDERSKLAWVHAAWTGWTASASTAMRIRMTGRVADRRP